MSEFSVRIAELLESSVAECVEGEEVAIAFSGGIDCSLVAGLAKKYAKNVHLYTVGTEGSHDMEVAAATAPLLGLGHTPILLDDSEIVDYLEDQINITGTGIPLVLAFEMPLYLVMKNCKEKIVLGGQGADELFAGYSKYVGLDDLRLKEEIAKDLDKLFNVTRVHESKLGTHFGKTVKYPYLKQEIVDYIRNLPLETIRPTDEDNRKLLLSEAARVLGFDFLYNRKKKAAQYGSGTIDAFRRICKVRNTTYNGLVSQLTKSIQN